MGFFLLNFRTSTGSGAVSFIFIYSLVWLSIKKQGSSLASLKLTNHILSRLVDPDKNWQESEEATFPNKSRAVSLSFSYVGRHNTQLSQASQNTYCTKYEKKKGRRKQKYMLFFLFATILYNSKYLEVQSGALCLYIEYKKI